MKLEKLSAPKDLAIKAIPEISFNITLKLFLEGGDPQGYRIQDFQTGFQQSLDYKGQPQHEVVGGIMTFVITQIPDEMINKWMMTSTLQKSGFFLFRMREEKPLMIEFTEAYCIGYEKSISAISGVCTRITISPKYITMNEKEHENRWKK